MRAGTRARGKIIQVGAGVAWVRAEVKCQTGGGGHTPSPFEEEKYWCPNLNPSLTQQKQFKTDQNWQKISK
jgi:hypothetical protein